MPFSVVNLKTFLTNEKAKYASSCKHVRFSHITLTVQHSVLNSNSAIWATSCLFSDLKTMICGQKVRVSTAPHNLRPLFFLVSLIAMTSNLIALRPFSFLVSLCFCLHISLVASSSLFKNSGRKKFFSSSWTTVFNLQRRERWSCSYEISCKCRSFFWLAALKKIKKIVTKIPKKKVHKGS